MAPGNGYALLAEIAGSPNNNSIYVVVAIITASGVVFAGIWKLVSATYKVSSTIKENSEAVKELTIDMKEMRSEVSSRITIAQHTELLSRVAALESQVMRRGDK